MITDTRFIVEESPEVRKSGNNLADFPTSGLSDSLRQYIRGKSLYFACKRAFDISVSALVVLGILSWLTPVLAVLIKISSSGPVFFFTKKSGTIRPLIYLHQIQNDDRKSRSRPPAGNGK